jgi:hypothetical protein
MGGARDFVGERGGGDPARRLARVDDPPDAARTRGFDVGVWEGTGRFGDDERDYKSDVSRYSDQKNEGMRTLFS